MTAVLPSLVIRIERQKYTPATQFRERKNKFVCGVKKRPLAEKETSNKKDPPQPKFFPRRANPAPAITAPGNPNSDNLRHMPAPSPLLPVLIPFSSRSAYTDETPSAPHSPVRPDSQIQTFCHHPHPRGQCVVCSSCPWTSPIAQKPQCNSILPRTVAISKEGAPQPCACPW